MQLTEFTATGNLLTLEVRSEIRKERYKRICRDMEKAVEKLGTVRLVLVMRHYPSLNSIEDLYFDLRFLRLYDHAIDKVAIVCDRLWKRTWIGVFSLFSGIRMACFGMNEVNEVTQWMRAGSPSSGNGSV